MPVATLTAPCPTKDKNVPTFSGTGPAGATLASGQLSNRLSTATAPKIAQETQKLHVRGDTIKCSIVSGEVTVNGEIRFEGKSKSSAPQPRLVPNVGAEADAAVTVDGSLKLTMVCESLSTNSITFGGVDDDDF